MAHDNHDEGLIRRYLLGKLGEDELQHLEEKLMADNELFDRVLLAEDEMVEEYVQGELSESDRKGFEASFLSTPEGRKQVSFAKALGEYVSRASASEGHATRETADEEPARVTEEPARVSKVSQPVWWRRPALVPYFRMAAAAIIVLGVGLGIWRVLFYRSEVAKGMAALAHAYRTERPVEARISGLNYAPYPNVRGSEQTKVDDTSLSRAERILLDEVSEHPSPAAHHALGRLYLAKQKFDRATDQFEKALKGDPNNAQLHSDYGAALLEVGKASQLRGEPGKSFEEFAQASEHLSRALELDGSLLEALFNRALCHEYMLLYREAERDWKDYIEKDKDPNSRWADEARKKLKDLEERPAQSSRNREQLFQDFLDAYKVRDDGRAWKMISENRDLTGSFIENKIIDSYLDLAASGRDDGLVDHIDVLSYAGELEYQQAGDRFINSLARFYESASPVQHKDILKARSLVKSGHENYTKNNFDAALDSYSGAKEAFERGGDTCEAAYVTYLVGNCYVQRSKAELGLSLLRPLVQTCERDQYRWLLARTFSAICNANQYLRDFSMAISNGNRCLEVSEEIDDVIGAVTTRHLVADAYRFVDDSQRALDLHAKNLPLACTYVPQPAQLWRHYASISLTFDQLDLYAAAIGFQKEALQLAIDAEAPRLICRSYNFLGELLAKRGDYSGAASNIERALEIGSSLPDGVVRTEAAAYSHLLLGYIYRKSGNFGSAIESYDQAIRSYGELDSKFFDYIARKEKLLCCLEHGGCSSLEQEMEKVLDLFEQHRAKILEDSIRNTFFDAEQTIYDVAIEFQYYNKGNAKKAFEYSERSRGRSLSDLISNTIQIVDNPHNPDVRAGEVTQPLSIEEIQAQIPAQAQILQYAVLSNNILIWVISKEEPVTASQSISIVDLNKRVNNFLELIAAAKENNTLEAFTREAMSLYDLLIKPVERSLDGGKQLCIVPDKILNYLPFAALRSQTSEKFLIEEQGRGIVLSPSSNIYVLCSDAARERELRESERLMSVGNPLFDSKSFPHLAELRSAVKEVKTIAENYDSPGPIIGASATKPHVMSEMEKSEVIHLATHAIADEWYPMRSKLLLSGGASGKESDGVLQAYEIYRLNLSRAKLVVLSACQTGVEKYYRGEGMIGLARPFIAKRIPLVVASLWPVNSEATATLMISFHRLRKKGGLPAAEALRQAQREMLESSDSNNRLPYNWASFVAIGGYTSF